jgi:hypothetical protein
MNIGLNVNNVQSRFTYPAQSTSKLCSAENIVVHMVVVSVDDPSIAWEVEKIVALFPPL